MIYLSSPYSSPDKIIREQRARLATQEVIKFLNKGLNVYSPVSYYHNIITIFSLPMDKNFWWKYNSELFKMSRMVYVLCIDGYYESVGVRQEVAFAIASGIPIFYSTQGEFHGINY